MIDWFTGLLRGLDDEHVLLADVVQDLDEDVLVGELEDLDRPRLDTEVAADLPGELRVRVAVVDLELVRVHGRVLQPTEPGAHARPLPGGPPVPGLASGPPLSSLSRPSANPGRNAAIPTTRSPSFRRMTITPRAFGE